MAEIYVASAPYLYVGKCGNGTPKKFFLVRGVSASGISTGFQGIKERGVAQVVL